MNTDKKAESLREFRELAPIQFAVIGAVRVKIPSKMDAPFGEADSYREPQRFHPCPSLSIRGKKTFPIKLIAPSSSSKDS
jgi:hypothetical protein